MQLNLDLKPLRSVVSVEEDSKKSILQLQFEAFHRSNPHVLDLIVELAWRQRRAGRDRGSISQIFEVLRYSYSLQTASGEFKLANAHRAYYARLVLAMYPHLSDGGRPFFVLARQSTPYVIDWRALDSKKETT